MYIFLIAICDYYNTNQKKEQINQIALGKSTVYEQQFS